MDWGVCHGDLHGYNAHIEGNKVTHFDFDICGFGWRSYDLAVFKFTLDIDSANKGKEQEVEKKWAAFLEGYQSIRTLNVNDFKVIPVFIAIRRLWLMSTSLEYFRDIDIIGSVDAEEKYFKDELEGFGGLEF